MSQLVLKEYHQKFATVEEGQCEGQIKCPLLPECVSSNLKDAGIGFYENTLLLQPLTHSYKPEITKTNFMVHKKSKMDKSFGQTTFPFSGDYRKAYQR